MTVGSRCAAAPPFYQGGGSTVASQPASCGPAGRLPGRRLGSVPNGPERRRSGRAGALREGSAEGGEVGRGLAGERGEVVADPLAGDIAYLGPAERGEKVRTDDLLVACPALGGQRAEADALPV